MGVHCKSCLCKPRAIIREKYIKKCWDNIKFRIENPNSPDYKYYGGRGITMLDEWSKDYSKFEEYILTELGQKPEGTSLDRIDNNGGYYPSNLRWATYRQQIMNRSLQ